MVTTSGPGVSVQAEPARAGTTRLLDALERLGNRFPDPVVLFLGALGLTWVASALLAGRDFGLIDPRTARPLQVVDQLTLEALVSFFTGMTQAFVTFAPLGMVLVMVIGVGVAERSGLVGGILRGVLAVAPARLLTPIVVAAAVFAHVLSDSAVIVVVPLAGALFFVAGRHPLAGIVASFGALYGVLFASFVPLGLDAIMAGFSQSAARLIAPTYQVNPLANYWLAVMTACITVPVTWWVVERVVEPRIASMVVDGDPGLMPAAPVLTTRERRALWSAAATVLVLAGAFAWAAGPADSPFRAADGSLTGPGSPVMLALIPLLLMSALLPSLAYGVVAGTLRSHRDAIEGMTTTMSSMGYYIVMVFFAAQFTRAFGESNIGALLALEGTRTLQALHMPTAVMIVGVIVLAAVLDVVVPSASAKWALLAPILVPMLMGVGIAPELTQAAFRVGDGPVNLVTPLMPYFPLVLAFCRRYVTGFGLGSLMALVFPLGVTYLLMQTIVLLVWWGLGLPLGVGGRYVYP